jgi:AcrR family transcriptional regulator
MRDKQKRRNELLNSARDVFARKGYHEARVEDIVAAAHVAKGTFYLYFPDKRSIFVELVDRLFARISSSIVEVDVKGDVQSQIKHNIRAIIAVLLDDPTVTQILLSYTAVPDQKFLHKIRLFYDGVTRMLSQALQNGQKMGIVEEGDAELFATFTIGALKESLLEIALTPKSYSRERLVTVMTQLLEGGYLRFNPTTTQTTKIAHVDSLPARRKAAAH